MERFHPSNMGLGTKNRQNQTADLCSEHLRVTYAAQGVLVEDFIVEIEGSGKTRDILKWEEFTNMARDTTAMLGRLDEQFNKWLNGDV
jgi:tetrahydromethanopterin S-methyltransferase subunit C